MWLFSWCLNAGYLLLMLLLSPWLIFRAVTTGRYREGFSEKFLGRVPFFPGNNASAAHKTQKRVWVHAVSVGEVQLAGTLLKALRARFPDFAYAVSTTSKTGMELARKKFPELTVFYCPLDFTWSVDNAFRRLRPDVLILVELELWPNLLFTARKRGVPVVVVNARLGEKSFRGYRRLGFLTRSMIRTLTHILAQDPATAERFRALGAEDAQVTEVGSMKYDGAVTDRRNPRTQALAGLWGVKPDDVIFLAGSTQAPEEKLALNAFHTLKDDFPHLRLILVPRHPERFPEVAELLENGCLPWDRRSAFSDKNPPAPPHENENHTPARILLVDTVGELGAFWGLAEIGFVGGSMGTRGGQNMIEAAAYGSAVCFGPNTWNFRDIVAAMLAHHAAVVVEDGEDMTDFVRRCMTDTKFADTLRKNVTELIHSQLGATEKTVNLLAERVFSETAAPQG